MRDKPLYGIGTVAELLGVQADTLRAWERRGLLDPVRRHGRRCYTDADLQRMVFIKHFLDDRGLNISGIREYIRLYPCWENDRCPSLQRLEGGALHAKPCWKQPDARCGSPLLDPEPCGSCRGRAASPACRGGHPISS